MTAPFAVPAGSTCAINVTVATVSIGPKSALLNIATDDTLKLSFDLHLTRDDSHLQQLPGPIGATPDLHLTYT